MSNRKNITTTKKHSEELREKSINEKNSRYDKELSIVEDLKKKLSETMESFEESKKKLIEQNDENYLILNNLYNLCYLVLQQYQEENPGAPKLPLWDDLKKKVFE